MAVCPRPGRWPFRRRGSLERSEARSTGGSGRTGARADRQDRARAILGLLVAGAAGAVSFFSPCTWPLYPAYLGQLAAGGRRPLAAAALFALGFTMVFLGLGASASALGRWLGTFHLPLRQLGGLMILGLGLALAGLLPAPVARFLGQDLHPRARPEQPAWGALVTGMAFAFGWTPCVGPVLASILVLAARTASLGQGLLLLFAYSLGFAGPFLALALLLARGLRPRVPGILLPLLSRIGGVVLAGLGLLVLTGRLSALATYLHARF
jgi:cytochrome c-type biogenesis protein